MALIKLESAEVVRHVGTRGAFAVNETIILPDGRSFPKSYTVWADEAPAVGSIVQVYGQMSAKLREYAAPTGIKQAIDISINEPTVTIMGTPKPDTAEETAAAILDMAATTGKELPF